MEDNIFKMINMELMKKDYTQFDNIDKVLLVQDELRNYLLKRIVKNKCIKSSYLILLS